MQAQDEALAILVVDDQEDTLVEMQELLEGLGRTVCCVNSGAAALARMAQGNVCLVLMDVQMPGIDGFEVARKMRANPDTHFTPIIFMSGMHLTEALLNEGYSAGAVDFMTKPVHPTMLWHKARVLLEHDLYRRRLFQASQQLECERAFVASILDNTAEGIVVVSKEGKICFANPAITRMLGCLGDELQGTEFVSWIDTSGDAGWLNSVWFDCWQRGQTYRTHDASLRNRDGRRTPIALSCSPLPQGQQAMTILALDMSAVRELHLKLEAMAITDMLTGLHNRRGFVQSLQAAISRSERTGRMSALLYLDLDGFKQINDEFGHSRGDEALRWVSNQLQACLRPCDLIARIGGDEFTVIIESIDSKRDIVVIAETLINQLSAAPDGFRLGASIGIALIPVCGNTVEGLMRAADTAMYEAKHQGKGQHRFASGK